MVSLECSFSDDYNNPEVYIGLRFVLTKFLQMVPDLVDGSYDVSLRVVGTAQHKVQYALRVLLAIPDPIACRYLLPLFGAQV